MLHPLSAIAAASALLIAANAAAQTEPTDASEPRRFRVGLGAQIVPSYPGSDRVAIRPLVDVATARGDRPFAFEAPDDSFGFPLLDGDGFAVGPALDIVGSRRKSGTGVAIDEVGTTIEAGGFVQYWLAPSLRTHVELRKGIGGHRGLVGNIGLDYVARDRDRWLVSIGPRIALSDRRYRDAWFGVSPREAAATGLPAFAPGDKVVHAVGATLGGIYQLDDRWGLYAYAKYDRLVGDAARSPVVRSLGSRDQLSGGLALTYSFTIGRR